MPRIGTQAHWPFPTAPGLGISAEELKVTRPTAEKDPAITPIAQTAPTEFLNPSTSSEHLRLQTPVAANPMATPTGPLHDHIQIREAAAKAASELSRSLYQMVAKNEVDLPSDRKNQIRASLAREQALFGLLKDVQEMQSFIYGRIIGSAEA